MPKVTFVTQSTRDADNIASAPERLVNLYPVPAPDGARTALNLRSVLGRVLFSSLGGVFLRQIATVNDRLYAVGRGALWRINSKGIANELAEIDDTGPVSFSGNGADVTISSGGNYYVLRDNIIQSPGDGAFVSVGSIGFLDQYTLLTQRGGNKWEWTALANAVDRDALNFGTCEADNDNVLRVMTYGPYVFLFNERTIEIWYNTGEGDENAFRRLGGGVIDVGLLAPELVAKHSGGLFFVGDDRVAYLTSGTGVTPISHPGLERAMEVRDPTHCFYYEDRGHKFCCIRFEHRPAWCYDITTGFWHERSSGVDHGPWEVISTAQAYGKWFSATEHGGIFAMERTNADSKTPLRRTAISRPFYQDGERFRVQMLEILGKFGAESIPRFKSAYLSTVGSIGAYSDGYDEGHYIDRDGDPELIYAQEVEAPIALMASGFYDEPPQIMLRISKDGGVTWGLEKWRTIGNDGERRARAVYRGLGQFRNMAIEVNMTDPVDVTLYSDCNVVVA
jgi:hypothetical protein